MTPEWNETAAGWAMKAYGIAEPDPEALVTRGEEIRAEVDLSHRVAFRTGQEMSDEAAFTAASAERGVGVIFSAGDVGEWSRRMRRTHPLWEEPGCLSLADGVVVHAGRDPVTGEPVLVGGSPEVRARVLAGQCAPRGGMQQGVAIVHFAGQVQ